jgi:hypothetical protein
MDSLLLVTFIDNILCPPAILFSIVFSKWGQYDIVLIWKKWKKSFGGGIKFKQISWSFIVHNHFFRKKLNLKIISFKTDCQSRSDGKGTQLVSIKSVLPEVSKNFQVNKMYVFWNQRFTIFVSIVVLSKKGLLRL